MGPYRTAAASRVSKRGATAWQRCTPILPRLRMSADSGQPMNRITFAGREVGDDTGDSAADSTRAKNPTTARPLERVLAHLDGARRSGAGWIARCPHHDDGQPSLSIKETDDGRVLLHCFAGCPNRDVVQSAGLAFVDLFPPGSRERRGARVWGRGITPMAPHGHPAFASIGDDVPAAMLAELARMAHVRGALDARIADALRVVGAAVGVSDGRLAEAARAALDCEESA